MATKRTGGPVPEPPPAQSPSGAAQSPSGAAQSPAHPWTVALLRLPLPVAALSPIVAALEDAYATDRTDLVITRAGMLAGEHPAYGTWAGHSWLEIALVPVENPWEVSDDD